MGEWFEIKLEGAKELERKLKSLEPKIAKKLVRQSLRAAAKPILNLARAKCPVVTEELKKSIKIRAMKRRKNSFGVLIGTASKWFMDYFYGAHVEFGTSKISARPYIRPAFDEKKNEAEKILKQELVTTINEAAKSG